MLKPQVLGCQVLMFSQHFVDKKKTKANWNDALVLIKEMLCMEI